MKTLRECGRRPADGAEAPVEGRAPSEYAAARHGSSFLPSPRNCRPKPSALPSLCVVVRDADEAEAVLSHLEGNLTGCIYSDTQGSDEGLYARLAPALRRRVGRLLNDKMPTGVAVSPAMNHGGPFPATGHPGFTAVGIPASFRRFGMLCCYDNVREHRLPPRCAIRIRTAGCGGSSTARMTQDFAVSMSIIRIDPEFDALVPRDARIEKVAGGFTFTEGPLWRPSGVLWFSDVVGNVVRQWSPDGTVVTELLRPGGYDGNSLPAGGFIGPNGMTTARTAMCCCASTATAASCTSTDDLRVTTLVDNFEGKQLNAPNDLVFRSDGTLFFTDPPYGLPRQDDDPEKDLPFNGVFKLSDGKVDVIIKDLTRPNGIAFSPDEKTLYVSNSDDKRRIWMRYDVAASGTVQQRPRVLRRDGPRRRRPARWDEDRRARQYLGDRAQRGLRVLARWNASRHHQAAGRSRELRLGRRRPDAVHHGRDGPLSSQDVGHGAGAGVFEILDFRF